MKLVNFVKKGKNTLGILTDRGVADVSEISGANAPATVREALAMGREESVRRMEDGIRKIREEA